MKILNLRFKNINSLKGEWEIAFDRYPLADAAVFAITGPNGSGKTSILDSISLALYGETFRLKQPAEQIITRDAADCYSEVTFSLGKESYRARWNFQRSGQEGGTAMELTHLNGEEKVLATRVQDVRSRVTELTGLNFKRFTRSIMLAQGDFTAFLNALDTERAEILEKITGTDVYADYFEQLDRDIEKAHQELLGIKEEIAAIPVMGEEELKSLQQEIAEFQEQWGEQQAVLEDFTKEGEWLEALERMEKEIGREQIALADAEQRRKQRESDLARADAAQKALAHRAELEAFEAKRREAVKALAVLEQMQKEAAEIQQQLNALNSTRVEIERELDQVQQVITAHELKKTSKAYHAEKKKRQRSVSHLESVLRKKRKAHAKIVKWLSKHDKDRWLAEAFAEVGYHIARLKMAQDRRALAESQYEATAAVCKQGLAAINKVNASIAKLESKAAQLKAVKDNTEHEIRAMCGGASLGALEERYEETTTKLDHYEQLIRILEEHRQLLSEREKIRKRAVKKEPALHDLQQHYDALAEQLAAEENIWRALDKAVVLEAYIRQYSEDRIILEEGERCPLCGSYDHPFVTDGVPEADSTKALADQTEKVAALRKKLDALSARLTRLDQTPAMSLTNQKINALVIEWNNIRTMLGLPQEEMSKEAIQRIGREKHALKMELQRQAKLIKEAVKYGQKIASIDANIQMIEGELVEERIRLNQLDSELSQEQKGLLDLEMELKTAREEEKGQQEALRGRLAEHGITLPEKNGRFVQKLETKTAAFREQMQAKQVLDKELAALTEELQVLEQALADLEAQHDADAKRLQEIEAALAGRPTRSLKALNKELTAVTAKRDSLLEQIGEVQRSLQQKQEQIREKEIDMKLLQDEQQSLQRTVLEKAAVDGFQTIEALRASMLSVAEQQRIREDWNAVDKECRQLISRVEATRKKLEEERSRQLSSRTMEAIERQVEQVSEHQRQVQEQLTHAEAMLQEQRDHQAQAERMQQVFEEQERACARLDEEKREMDVKTAPDRRKCVQGMLFDRLLQLSNRHLEKISGRYYIRRSDENGFGLLIEDMEQGGFRRGIETLSGGESFVVSLALALGLSDVANNGTRIDSLFLDEGLGSLDEETLYMVLSTLEDLHKNGKTVGVISHVKELKEKIHTQIRAVKLEGGISRLEVIP
jgi:DNA repair protein SbcC/Rad50